MLLFFSPDVSLCSLLCVHIYLLQTKRSNISKFHEISFHLLFLQSVEQTNNLFRSENKTISIAVLHMRGTE